MKLVRRSAVLRGKVLGAGMGLALMGALLAVPAHAAPASPGPAAAPTGVVGCPAPVPIGDVKAGQVAQGWTVVRGTSPQPFRVDVLGVLTDGIGAGRDMIMIEVSDLPGGHVIDQGGGIWAGMSGSPVYLNGRLLGAVSYGFTAAPSPIGGLTPASDMIKLFNVSGAAAPKPERGPEPAKIRLSATQRRSLNARANATVPGGGLERLRTPVSVSGLTGKRLSLLQQEFDAAGRQARVYSGGRAAAGSSTAAAATLEAGGNFAAVETYGDVTIAGVGTTTAVCGQRALAFGHPMNWTGKVSYGANAAASVAIVRDATLGSFKMANLAGTVGIVEQDRLSGLRARLGAGPRTVPVTSTITNADSGARRAGTTRVADPAYLGLATAYGVWANYDSTFDRIGRGQATTSWIIRGTRAHGAAFTISRSNRWSSLDDVSDAPAREAAAAVDALNGNVVEPVTLTSVNFTSTVRSNYQQYRIVQLAASVNGGTYRSPQSLRVRVGDKITVRTTLRKYRSSANHYSSATFTVTKSMAGRAGSLRVLGGVDAASPDGQTGPGCLLGACGGEDESLNSVIKSITAAPRNDDVVATLSLDPPDGGGNAITTTVTKRRGWTVAGQRSIGVAVR